MGPWQWPRPPGRGAGGAALSRGTPTGTLTRLVRPRSERFTTPGLDGVFLHALHRGEPSRPKLVLLHGGGANAHWWDHLASALARDCHVVALDFRGHGASDHPDEIVAGAFQRDLAALLEHLSAPQAALVGHSMGGEVALAHAAGATATRAVVAIDVARGASPRTRRAMRLGLSMRTGYSTREEAVARYRFLPPAPYASEALRCSIAEHSVYQAPDGRFRFRFDPRWFSLPARSEPPLERIACPTLVVRGAESSLMTAEGAAQLVRRIPRARLVELAEAGHHVHLDQPQACLEVLRSFLIETMRGPGS